MVNRPRAGKSTASLPQPAFAVPTRREGAIARLDMSNGPRPTGCEALVGRS